MPTSHQGAARPDVKNSLVLELARRQKKSAGRKLMAMLAAMIAQSSVAKWKGVFGYPNEWFEQGFVDQAWVEEQARIYDTGEDKDIQHFKWAVYRRALRATDFTDREAFRRFVACLEADPNEHLYKGAAREVLNRKLVPPEWFLEFRGSRLMTDPKLSALIATRVAEREGAS